MYVWTVRFGLLSRRAPLALGGGPSVVSKTVYVIRTWAQERHVGRSLPGFQAGIASVALLTHLPCSHHMLDMASPRHPSAAGITAHSLLPLQRFTQLYHLTSLPLYTTP